jgi:hypothetical protein
MVISALISSVTPLDIHWVHKSPSFSTRKILIVKSGIFHNSDKISEHYGYVFWRYLTIEIGIVFMTHSVTKSYTLSSTMDSNIISSN